MLGLTCSHSSTGSYLQDCNSPFPYDSACSSCHFFFLQPQRHHVLSAVTTLIVDGRGISEPPVPILPLLVHLQILEVSHLPLPSYDASTSLPFLSTLKQLKLRAVPIHWMAGREFRCIEDCTIIHAIGQQSIQERIDLPSCRTLTYEGHPISTLQYFHAPQVKQIVLNSYDTRRRRVQQHLDIYAGQMGRCPSCTPSTSCFSAVKKI
jgi:hypothetical protein